MAAENAVSEELALADWMGTVKPTDRTRTGHHRRRNLRDRSGIRTSPHGSGPQGTPRPTTAVRASADVGALTVRPEGTKRQGVGDEAVRRSAPVRPGRSGGTPRRPGWPRQ